MNIHKLINKLIHTNILDTITKFIANYVKRPKAYITFRNTASTQHKLKKWRSTTLSNIYISDILNTYISNLYLKPISQTHITHNLCRRHHKYCNTRQHTDSKTIPTHHLRRVQVKIPHIQLKQTTCTLLTLDPAEYNTRIIL